MKTFLGIIILFSVSYYTSFSQNDWKISAPELQDMDTNILSELETHIQRNLPHMRSLLIARHGVLVYEKYYNGTTADDLQNMHSATKSVTSALIGIALYQGYVSSLDNKIIDYYKEFKDSINDPRINNITIRHLLTMSSGIDEIPTMFGKDDKNPNKTTLLKELMFNPGSEFKYSSPSSHLLSGILFKTTGISVFKFAEENLFHPLGIKQVIWYSDLNGLQYGCGSSLWRARDLLKFGQLYLNNGKWNEIQIVPSKYVNESVKKQISGFFYGSQINYGYLWWISNISGYNVFSAEGYGSQILRIIPELEMVVLCTSDWEKPVYFKHEAIIKDYIIPSVMKDRKK